MPLFILKTEGCIFEAADINDVFRALGENFMTTAKEIAEGKPPTIGPCLNSELTIEPYEE